MFLCIIVFMFWVYNFFWCFCLMIFWLNAWMLYRIQIITIYKCNPIPHSCQHTQSATNNLKSWVAKKNWSLVPYCKCAVSRVFETLGPDCCQRAPFLSTRTWPDPMLFIWLVWHACQSTFPLEPKKKRRGKAKCGRAEICWAHLILGNIVQANPSQSFSCSDECCYSHWIPNFACAIIRGMVSERRIVEVQWSSGVPFWMPTAHRYESMFDSCLQSWFRRSSTSAPSLDEIQATDHQKVCSKRRFPKWRPQVEAVNAGSTRSARSIRHPTSKTWLTISNFQLTSSHCSVACLQPQRSWGESVTDKKGTPCGSFFVDVPLQNLGNAWIGLDRTLCREGCFGGQLGRGEWIHFDNISIIMYHYSSNHYHAFNCR